MGVDTVIMARPAEPIDDEAFQAMRTAFHEEFRGTDAFDDAYPWLCWATYEPVPTIEVSSLARFYGPGYERGDWPHIRSMADWLAVALGETGEVRYGSDSGTGEWGDLAPWPEARAQMEPHWEAHGNEPYNARIATW